MKNKLENYKREQGKDKVETNEQIYFRNKTVQRSMNLSKLKIYSGT